ncbi:hypothetical protein KUTeg_008477 [Tegillarca granosa]|uniref:PXA domain-containing protein n=1 Tax=Tegillarca granosa TaxID=220873 RepID=A0ABQ9FCH1_TEGGR|nr:hypothetical protein KUTeg_008477 [Tegillarca granosa]
MSWLDGGWKWPALGLALFILTFGSLAFLSFFYFFCLVGGGLMIAYYHGREKSQKLLMKDVDLSKSRSGIRQIMSHMEKTTRFKNFDKRMTGASVIDEVLQEVLEFATKDYIKSWYRQVSDHDGFLLDIRQSKEVDWMPYFTQRLVNDFASHIRLYRRAIDKVQISSKDEKYEEEIERLFFDFEKNMEGNMCRDLVSLSKEEECQYLRDLSEALLFLLLPTEDFHNKTFRFMIREVLVNGIFLPTVDLVSDPDYINQYLSWLCKETTFTSETFLTVIKSSDSIEELEAVKEMVDQDIARWRSKDTGGTGGKHYDYTLVKQNLNSLLFVKSICEGRIKRIKSGANDLDFGQDGFRAAAGQQIHEAQQRAMGGVGMEADLESLRRAAMIIYDQYLSDKATSKIKMDSDIVKRTLQRIKSRMLSEDVFDEVQAKTWGWSVKQNPKEKATTSVLMMNDETGMDNSDEKSMSKMRSRTNSSLSVSDACISAYISQTGIVKESDKTGKSYAVFAIRVTRQVQDDEEILEVYRRYSDFHDLNMLIQEKVNIIYFFLYYLGICNS